MSSSNFLKSMQYRQHELNQLNTTGLRLQENQDPGWTVETSNGKTTGVLTHPQYGRLALNHKGEFTHEKPGPSHQGMAVTKPVSDLGHYLKDNGHLPEFKMVNGHTTITKPLADAASVVKGIQPKTAQPVQEANEYDELARLMSKAMRCDWR